MYSDRNRYDSADEYNEAREAEDRRQDAIEAEAAIFAREAADELEADRYVKARMESPDYTRIKLEEDRKENRMLMDILESIPDRIRTWKPTGMPTNVIANLIRNHLENAATDIQNLIDGEDE
jgi:predicted DNA binding CopG/RHH family protein